VNPARPSQVVAGSSGVGGYFQSVDGGANWTIVATNVACGGLNAMAFDRAGSTVYLAATAGVCRSSDGGATWSVAGLAGLGAASILIDPATPSTIYAGTSPDLSSGAGGIFVSTDSGQTFTPLGSGFAASTVGSLALDPATHLLYAGTVGAGVAELIPVPDRGDVVEVAHPPRATRDVEPRR